MEMQHVLEMKDITVKFSEVKAVEEAAITLKSGEIHALVGANGAGKSTLMKVLSGVNAHYTGEIWLDGKLVEIRSPKDAKQLGIEIVYQEVDSALVPNLTVAENIMLNYLANHMQKKTLVEWKRIRQKAKEALEKLKIDLDVNMMVSQVPLAKKQMILIARAMVEDCKFLMLDEPTAPLSNTEAEELFSLVRELAEKRGVGIVFISHRLREIFEICQFVTIMRNGRIVKECRVDGELTILKVVESMLGRKVVDERIRIACDAGEEVLRVEHLCNGNGSIADVSLSVRRGELIGIAGLVGAGKTELCKLLFGADHAVSGEIYLAGRRVVNKSPARAVRNGFALVPEERRKEGIEITAPVYSNLSRTNLQSFCNRLKMINFRMEREKAKSIISDLKIKVSSETQEAGLLSGGNQQKVAVGKWFVSNADVYIFDEPTKGVDIGAKQEIYQLIQELTKQGKGVIYATCEFSEILSITDRTYVMYNGSIIKEMRTEDTDEEQLLYYSTGGE